MPVQLYSRSREIKRGTLELISPSTVGLFIFLVRADVCDDMCLEDNFGKLNIYRVAEVCTFLKKDRSPSVLLLTMPIYGLVEHSTSESLHGHQISIQTSLFWTW